MILELEWTKTASLHGDMEKILQDFSAMSNELYNCRLVNDDHTNDIIIKGSKQDVINKLVSIELFKKK
jgi:hypothetical protein